MPRTILVKNISATVPDDEVRRFFSFCGHVDQFDLKKEEGKPSTATITYSKETSAGTAALLNDTELGGLKLEIERRSVGEAPSTLSPEGERSYDAESDVPQEHKPRRRVLAELLAHGYGIGDKAIAQAIELDKTHGLSTQLESWLKNMEAKYKPQERARDLDTKYDLTGQVTKFISKWRTYFEKPLETASNTYLGLQLRGFYNNTLATAQSVHEEAKFIQAQKYPAKASQQCGCEASAAACTCAVGACGCDKCPKNTSQSSCCKTEKESCCAQGECSEKAACKESCPQGQCKDGECAKSGTSKAVCDCKDGECVKSQCGKGGDCGKSCRQSSSCACAAKAGDCGCASQASACVCAEGECKCAGCAKAAK